MSPPSDVVLQDVCQIVGTEIQFPPHTPVWFRNIYGGVIGGLGQCEDPAAPLVTKATTCNRIVETGDGDDDAGSILTALPLMALLGLVSAAATSV